MKDIFKDKKKENKEKRSKISKLFKDIYITIDLDAKQRGDDLGIFIYPLAWCFIIFFLIMFDEVEMISMNTFYLVIDLGVIIFIVFYFIEKFFKQKREGKKFDPLIYPSFSQVFRSVIFCSTIFILYVIIIRIFNGSILDNYIFKIYSLFRVIPTEELFFRGLIMFGIVFVLSKIFNNNENRKSFRLRENIIWTITIFLSGIIFGLAHLRKFYDPINFPFFYILVGGQVLKIHIFVPISQLSLLGILLGWVRFRYGIYASMGVHFFNNLFGNAIIYAMIL